MNKRTIIFLLVLIIIFSSCNVVLSKRLDIDSDTNIHLRAENTNIGVERTNEPKENAIFFLRKASPNADIEGKRSEVIIDEYIDYKLYLVEPNTENERINRNHPFFK